jgi:hypothetical protein
MRILLSLIALLSLVGPASAGTKFKTNLVPPPADCYGGLGVCLNNGASCNDVSGNSDCGGAGVSSKSAGRSGGGCGRRCALVQGRLFMV